MPCFSCFTFHFHQIVGLKDSIVTTMMLMRPVCGCCGQFGTSLRREVPCMRRHFIELDRLYQCCVPLIVRGVCTDS